MRDVRGIDASGNCLGVQHYGRQHLRMTRVGRVDDGVAAALLGTPSVRGPRIRRVTGSFTDGPFVETKELLG